MQQRRHLLAAACASVAGSTIALPSWAQSNYPTRDISGIIQWGAGGGTDVAVRGYTPYAEEVLGRKILMSNRTGGAGAIGANFVLQQPADGYTLLMGAEPQALFKVMGLAPFDYDRFYPINIAAIANSIILVANVSKPWNTTQDVLSHIQANPKTVKQYMAGQGTVPFTVNAMVSSLTKFDTTLVQFDGDGPAIAALQGGHIDIGFIASGAVIEHVRAGRLKALGVLDNKPFQGISPMTDAPSLKALPKYLPWGSWYGVFVRKETPDDIKAKLVAAYKKAGDNPKYRELMTGRGTTILNIAGTEAEDFIRKWTSTTAWLYKDVGVAKVDPATLGIPKP